MDQRASSGVPHHIQESGSGLDYGLSMLLDPLADERALAIIDVEANAKALTDGAADNRRNIDCGGVGQGKGNVNWLANRERHGRLELHATDGEIPAFRRDAVEAVMALNGDRSFEGYASGSSYFAAELELSFRRYPPLGSRTTP